MPTHTCKCHFAALGDAVGDADVFGTVRNGSELRAIGGGLRCCPQGPLLGRRRRELKLDYTEYMEVTVGWA